MWFLVAILSFVAATLGVMALSKSGLLVKSYLVVGSLICFWFLVGALAGWKAPELFSGLGGGRGSGYFGGGWWGGK